MRVTFHSLRRKIHSKLTEAINSHWNRSFFHRYSYEYRNHCIRSHYVLPSGSGSGCCPTNLTKLKKFTLDNACISLLEGSFSLTKEEGLGMFWDMTRSISIYTHKMASYNEMGFFICMNVCDHNFEMSGNFSMFQFYFNSSTLFWKIKCTSASSWHSVLICHF